MPTPTWLPSRRALLVATIAFVVGLLVFVALWLDQRNSNTFYRSLEAPRSVAGQVFDPLPVPLAGGADAGNVMGTPDSAAADAPFGPPPERSTAPPPSQAALPAAAPAVPAPTAADQTTPRLVASPAPRYPRDAQRRGQAGTVLLQIQVSAQGVPTGVDLVQSSGTRSLDRAAVDAVRRWRFEPAIRDGQPVAGTIQVPITFTQ